MRKTIIAGTAIALSFGIAGPASAAVLPVTELGGDWAAKGPVTMTDHGIHFDINTWSGATVKYSGFHGKLSEITDLAYTARYNTSATEGRDAPYLRIFFTNGKDAIYDPTTTHNDKGTLSENADHTRNVTAGSWRYDDDCGNGILDSTEVNGCGGNVYPQPGTPGYDIQGADFAKLVADHGDEQVDYIAVSAGNAFHEQVEAVMTRLRVNGDEFIFGATGPQGPKGEQGTPGATVIASVPAATQQTIIQPSQAVQTAPTLIGNTKRTIRVSLRKGEKLLSVRATLRGKRLPVHGRSITVDLRGRNVGGYNVYVSAKYKAKSGRVHVVRSSRALSIAADTAR